MLKALEGPPNTEPIDVDLGVGGVSQAVRGGPCSDRCTRSRRAGPGDRNLRLSTSSRRKARRVCSLHSNSPPPIPPNVAAHVIEAEIIGRERTHLNSHLPIYAFRASAVAIVAVEVGLSGR